MTLMRALPVVNATYARQHLYELVRQAKEKGPTLIAGRRPDERAVLLSQDEYNALIDGARDGTPRS